MRAKIYFYRVKALKKCFIIAIFVIITFLCTSCRTTTITENSNDYIYGFNEEIKILDMESKGVLATVKITGISVLKDQPFELKEVDHYDQSNNPVYENITYNQIIQIYYVYKTTDSTKNISSSNFSVKDSKGEQAIFDPDTDFKAKALDGNNSMIVALKNRSDFINIQFKYNPLQLKSTANIKLNIKSDVQSISSSLKTESSSTKSIESKQNNDGSINKYLVIAIFVLLLLVIVLSVLLIIAITRKRK